MRIVVSGTHASGKSTLVSDFALLHPSYTVLPDPFELIEDDEDPAGHQSLVRQLVVSAERLHGWRAGDDVIAERGPIDLLAYLGALTALGRGSLDPDLLERLRTTTTAAMCHVDVLALLPLDPGAGIWVDDEEDPDLREAMDSRLLRLAEDPDLVPDSAVVVELTGSPERRLAGLLATVADLADLPAR